ncbi:MAG: tetratricopeptide repeat protein [Waterburya sp.]
MKNTYYRTYLIVISLFLIPITLIALTSIAASESTIIAQDISPRLSLSDLVKSNTVKINSNVNDGWGIIIGKKNDTYIVLSKSNIFQVGQTFEIQTSDGKTYEAILTSNATKLNSNVALIEFNSKDSHNIAELNPSAIPVVGQKIITVGYNYRTRKLITTKGEISQLLDNFASQNNSIISSINTEKKIEEGAVFNTDGELLGITNQGIESFTYIGNFLQQLNPKISTNYQLPQFGDTLEIQTPLLTGKSKEIETKAHKITVRINSIIANDSEDINSNSTSTRNNDGSGVIVARKGNTYTVVTARHVLCGLENNINDCSYYKHTIITFDGVSHEIDNSTIAPAEAKDLATVQFTSTKDYEIATLADYPPTPKNYVFAGGYPKLSKTNDPKWQFSPGYALDKKQGSFKIIERNSLDKGYQLVYTCFTYEGMSGGPIVDMEGRVIGIHGATDRVYDKLPNEYIRLSIGYSLGIPVSIFTRSAGITYIEDPKDNSLKKIEGADEADELNLSLEQLKIESNEPHLDSKWQNDFAKAIESIEIPQNNAPPDRWLDRGNQLWRLLRYQEAEEAFEQAIKLNSNPNFVYLAWYGKGLALTEQNKYEEAIAAFEKAVRHKSDFYAALKLQALTIRELGKFDQALEVVNRAIKIKPENASLRSDRGGLLVKLGQFSAAEKAYTKAIDLEPQSIFYYDRSLLYGHAKEWKLALADLDRAIEVNPEYTKAYLNRGIVYKNLQELQLAFNDFNSAIQLDPNNAEAYLNRGALYGKQQKWDLALSDYSQAISLDSQNAEAYIGRGLVHFQLKKESEAIADLKKAQKLFSEQHDSVGYKKASHFLENLR